jgi:hypothetical protein
MLKRERRTAFAYTILQQQLPHALQDPNKRVSILTGTFTWTGRKDIFVKQ